MNVTIAENIVLITCIFYNAEFKRLGCYPPKFHFANAILICVVNILITVSTISLNAITLMACWRLKKLKEKKSYLLIALLSLNDLTIGVLGNPGVIVLHDCETLQKTKFNECATFILIQLVASCLIAISLTTLFLLNLERYLRIAHSFFHRNEVTKLRICATALVLWMLAILLVLS